tara:strand:+ start:146 stop:1429 length:1284 start_codon:yes stop_codon:yes gene_type:complete
MRNLLLAACAAATFLPSSLKASNVPLEIERDDEIITHNSAIEENDDEHPAAFPMPLKAGDFNLKMPKVVLSHLSTFQDLPDLLSFLKTSKKAYSQRERVLGMYLRKNRRDVFFKLNHFQWTPWNLPHSVTINVHRLFAEAQGEEDILKKGLSLFSAGCLGHQPAAQEFGKLWVEYNEKFPPVISLTDLSKDVSDYPLSRLNRPMTDNKDLADLRKELEQTCPEEGPTIPFLEELLDKLAKMDPYDKEVKSTTLIFKGIKKLLKEEYSFEGEGDLDLSYQKKLLRTRQWKEFTQPLFVITARTPYINFMLSHFPLGGVQTDTRESTFATRLNKNFVFEYIDSLYGKCTKPMEVIQQVGALHCILIFLGDNDVNSFMIARPAQGIMTPELIRAERNLMAFFYNLMKMREETHGPVDMVNPIDNPKYTNL